MVVLTFLKPPGASYHLAPGKVAPMCWWKMFAPKLEDELDDEVSAGEPVYEATPVDSSE